jgi:hypothetical protein
VGRFISMLESRREGVTQFLDAHTVAACDEALAKFFRHKTNPNDFEDLKQEVWTELLKRPLEVVRKLAEKTPDPTVVGAGMSDHRVAEGSMRSPGRSDGKETR